MIPTLPQNADPAQKTARANELRRQREQLRYDYDYLAPLAFAETVPKEHHPSVAWRFKLAKVVLTILRNTSDVTKTAGDFREQLRLPVRIFKAEAERQSLQNEILNRILEGFLSGRAKSFEEIQRLFVRIPAPPGIDEAGTDELFAALRVGGPNPMMLKRVDRLPPNLPVTDEQFVRTMGANDSLTRAIAEHRLYLADYPALANTPGGTFPNGQKFLAAPLALFAVPAEGADRRLRAVAIQCGQLPGATNPVFCPQDGLGWEVAKSFVQMADGNYHQAVFHLGQTHLVLEPIVIATCRQLPSAHPLNVLLMPHFEGTLNINDAAQSNLIAPQGGVDRVMGGTIAASRKIAVDAARSFDFNASMPPQALSARGVADKAALPVFPYRDDALLVWSVIRRWADRYLRIYYSSNADVAADTELQAWIAEMLSGDGGRMTNIGENGRLLTLDYLVDMVAHIIFIAGPQHAAVNFPQYPIMSYAPTMPLALYKAAPASIDTTSPNGLFDWLPPLDMMQLQMSLGYLLGSAQCTRLGIYARTDHGSLREWLGDLVGDFSGTGYFMDGRAQSALKAFHEDLREVEAEITKRNETRRPYPFLLPSRTPQSINI